ncbi:MAG: lipopolysaccharide biosynthesis protein [Deltaproteobacteria bacterium]|nr:MAG: lipopolysaccharide biosynthesis protein [Deltaproteobacteria bacterium]
MEQEKDLRFYWQILLARKHYFIWPAVAVLLLAVIVASALPPIYESKSTILIEEQQIPQNFVQTTVTGLADERIQSLSQLILSRTRLLEVIKQFNLYPQMREKYALEEIIEKMRNDIKVDLITAEVGTGRKNQGVTIAFTVAYQGKNPETVQRVAGTLASLYLEENLKIREQQAKTTTQFLEAELKEIEERLQTIGGKISEFKAKHGEILPELQQFNLSQAESLERQIDQLKGQIRAAEDRKIYLESQLTTINPDSPLISGSGERILDPHSRLRTLKVMLAELQARYSDDHPDIIRVKQEMAELEKMVGTTEGSPSMKRQKLTNLKAELAQKQSRYSDQHPEIIKLKREIAELESLPEVNTPAPAVAQPDNPAYINLLTNIQAATNDINMLQNQKADLEAKLRNYRQRLEDAPKVEQEYLALVRDYQNAHAKHQEIMNKILEARIAEGMEESQKAERFTLIDPASYPEKPISPNRPLIMLVGLFLSGGMGLGLVALTEHLDHSVKNADEVAWLTGVPVLGRITRMVTAEDLAQKIRRRRLLWSLVGLSILVSFVILHLFIMDLGILTAKIWRTVGKYT